MKTAELSGHLLDCWTGHALGKSVQIIKHQRDGSYFCSEEYAAGDMFIGRPTLKLWNPSEDWAIAGPIIQEKEIDLVYGRSHDGLIEMDIWVTMKDELKHESYGESPLIAVCRLIVWMEYGDEVPDEGEKE